MDLDIDTILDNLKINKSNRTRLSLDKLNGTLNDYYNHGGRDFSITTIGRVSAKDAGVGYESIRATANKHYRDLIEAWAFKVGTTTKKPLSSQSRSRQIPQDIQLLERIPDPAVRVLFGQIIAERNRYRTEANILKCQTQIVIDRRPVRNFDADAQQAHVEVFPSLLGVISENEIKALQFAISEECIERQGWRVTQAGQVKNELGDEVFPRGFMTALRKLLRELDGDQGAVSAQ